MKALYWNGVNYLRVGTVPDPKIVNSARCNPAPDNVDDLWIGSPLHRRLYTYDARRGLDRPRIHRRSGRDWA